MTIWLLASTAPDDQAAGGPFIPLGACGHRGSARQARHTAPGALARPGGRVGGGARPERSVTVRDRWGGNPTGGGYHGGLIARASGRVLDVVIGRHLRSTGDGNEPAAGRALGVVAALVLAAFLLVSECAYGGGMGARSKTCECLGVERELYDARPADGPHKTVCVGVVWSRTCYRMTGGPIVECPR